MDSKKQSELVKKYWEGQTTPEEEKALMASALEDLEMDDQAHFSQVKTFSEIQLVPDFEVSFLEKIEAEESAIIRPMLPNLVWKVAAVFLLGLSFYFLSVPATKMVDPMIAEAEEDPEKAFELAKQALLLVSAELNKAAEINVALDKFEETKAKITDDKR